jgi:thioredoxin-dependent peroxiredoxin
MLEINTTAPAFTLLDQDSKPVSLSDSNGSFRIVYFYPKDDTPGCTAEACTIAEAYGAFAERDIVVLGISADSPESHTKFQQKYNLPFTLLSDPDREVIAAYGAKGGFMTKRISYLIDPDGVIVKAYAKVDPTSHALDILHDFDDLAHGA